MKNKIEIYKTADNNTEITVHFDEDTVWLTQAQMVGLFNSSKANISEHIKHIYNDKELDKNSTVRKFRTVQLEGSRSISRERDHYNLDMIISVGYRVNSKRGIQFRQWATQRLKDYLVQGYAINEKRLSQKQQEVEYLRTGIRIAGRAIEKAAYEKDRQIFQVFARGLALLDDFDHEKLDNKGKSRKRAVFPDLNDYLNLIREMYSKFKS